MAGFSWLLVYRTEPYKRLKAQIERANRKCKTLDFSFMHFNSYKEKRERRVDKNLKKKKNLTL